MAVDVFRVRRVLVVDDDISFLTKAVKEMHWLEVDVAEDAESTLERCSTEQFDP